MAEQELEGVQDQANDDDVNTVEVENSDWIPRTRFNDVNGRMKAAEAELAKLRKAQAKAENEAEERQRKELEEQQKWQQLYEQANGQLEELNVYKERWDGLVQQTREANEAKIEALPAKFKSLVPEYDDPMKLSKWLQDNSGLFEGQSAPQLNGQAGSGSRSNQPRNDSPPADELVEQAVRLGVDPKAYAKQFGVEL